MGRIADALRANLRELALSDARSLRALDEELRAATGGGPPQPLEALPEDLRSLTLKELKARCRAAGLRGYSQLRKAELIDLLCGGGAGPAVAEPGHTARPGVEARMQRLEALLRLVAEQVGVPRERIEALLGP